MAPLDDIPLTRAEHRTPQHLNPAPSPPTTSVLVCHPTIPLWGGGKIGSCEGHNHCHHTHLAGRQPHLYNLLTSPHPPSPQLWGTRAFYRDTASITCYHPHCAWPCRAWWSGTQACQPTRWCWWGGDVQVYDKDLSSHGEEEDDEKQADLAPTAHQPNKPKRKWKAQQAAGLSWWSSCTVLDTRANSCIRLS